MTPVALRRASVRTCRTAALRRRLFACLGELNNMKVEPIGDKVVIKRLDAETKTAGGIGLPDTAKEKPRQGRVLSVGDGRMLKNGTRIRHQVSEGDRVLFTNWAGTEVVVDNEELLIMSEDDIL